MICTNEVYRYLEADKVQECIRIIELEMEYDLFYYVSLYTNFAVPKTYSLSRFSEELEQGIVIKTPDPYMRRMDEVALSSTNRQKRDLEWELVSTYWKGYKKELLVDSLRHKLFKQIVEEKGLSEVKVRRLFTRFFQRGMNKNAMLSDYVNSGGRGKEKQLSETKVGRPKKADYTGEVASGINITEDIKRLFEVTLEKHYRNRNQLSLKETYNRLLKDYFSHQYAENGEIKYKIWEEERIPTYNQFCYWTKKFEQPTKNIIERQGEKEYALKHRPILSNSTVETIGPGSRFQVDATIADIYLVSKLDRNRIIGRPVVYAIIDVFSRLVTGIYVGLEGPSWLGAMMALENMICDKVTFCEQYGIQIEVQQWPARHLPEVILADRGEFEGYQPENLINNLGIVIENTPPYRGDLKGIVERSFRTLNTKLRHQTPGAIMKEFRQRGDRDYRLDATLTLEEFTKIYIQMVLHHNSTPVDKYPLEKDMLAADIVAIPSQLWKWGIENKKGALRTIERELMRLNVLPKARASVSRAGIKFKGLLYGSHKALQEQWFINQRIRSIEILYDPRDMNYIYIPGEDGKSYETCYLLKGSQQYKDTILEEILFLQELQGELLEKQKQEQLNSDIILENEIQAIVAVAKKEKSKSTPIVEQSKTGKLRSIKKNREVEKELNRISEAFSFEAAKPNVEVAPVEPIITSKQKLMDKLKQKRDEKRDRG